MQFYDLVFVGSGLSSSATLYHVLANLQKQPHTTACKNIAVIEKSGEFWKGIAYGSRTSTQSLTINPVKDFFMDEDKLLFFNWLNYLNANNWPNIGDAEKEILSSWVNDNKSKLNDTDIDGVYIPRFLYGIYLAEKLHRIIAECKTSNLANVTLITGEAVDATQPVNTKQYIIDIQTAEAKIAIEANILILGTGSLDTRKINGGLPHQHLCIDDVYAPNLAINLKNIANKLAQLAPANRNILVIGSNASASEIVHILYKNSKAKQVDFNQITILSGSGLPDRLHVNLDYDYLLENLKALEQNQNYTADALITAIENDVKGAAQQQLSVGKIHYSLSDRAVKIQQKFSPEEAKKFFDNHGWTFTRITRRTSEAYYFTEEELVAAQKLQFIKGRFVSLNKDQSKKEGLTFIYKATGDTTEKEFETAFPIIINCAGAEHISATTSKLIKNLLDKAILKINENNMGIAVDEHFAAAYNLYIIGPLLAGIYNTKFKFWHLENAKRLNGLAPILAQTITAKML